MSFYCAEDCKWTGTEGFCPKHEGRSRVGWPEKAKDYTPKVRKPRDVTCAHCGKTFQVLRKTSEFCSKSCQRSSERKADQQEWSNA